MSPLYVSLLVIVDPVHLWVVHLRFNQPQFQSTSVQNILEKKIVAVLNMCRLLFSLPLFPEQYSITAVHIAFTVY